MSNYYRVKQDDEMPFYSRSAGTAQGWPMVFRMEPYRGTKLFRALQEFWFHLNNKTEADRKAWAAYTKHNTAFNNGSWGVDYCRDYISGARLSALYPHPKMGTLLCGGNVIKGTPMTLTRRVGAFKKGEKVLKVETIDVRKPLPYNITYETHPHLIHHATIILPNKIGGRKQVNPFPQRGGRNGYSVYYPVWSDGDVYYRMSMLEPVSYVPNPFNPEWNPNVNIEELNMTILNSLIEATVPTSDALLYVLDNPGVSPADRKVTLRNLLKIAGRERLTASRAYYVRVDGNDANTGLVNSAGGAFLTIQRAIDVVYGDLDLSSNDVTISVQAGTYTGDVTISNPHVGRGAVYLIGDVVNPANVKWSCPGVHTLKVTGGARIDVYGFEFENIGGGGAMYVTLDAQITAGWCAINSSQGFIAEKWGRIYWLNNQLTVNPGNHSGLYIAQSGGEIYSEGQTMVGVPNFTGAVFQVDGFGSSIRAGVTIGTATGNRFSLTNGGTLYNYTSSAIVGSTGGNATQECTVEPWYETVVLSANETRVSTTAVTNTGVAISLLPNTTYTFELCLFTTSDVANGIKLVLDASVTPTYIISQAVATYGTASVLVKGDTTDPVDLFGTTAVTDVVVRASGSIKTVDTSILTALTVQFAQNSSGAAASTLLKGSYMRVWRS